jgi:transcriptional antiterminator RfaH
LPESGFDNHLRSFGRITCNRLSEEHSMLYPHEAESAARDLAECRSVEVSECQRAADPVWCCLRSHPKREHIAAAQLSCIPGVEVFNPQLRLERQTNRGRMCFTESLFVNYLFARFVPQTTLEKVRYTPSVKTVLQFGGEVATIPEHVIEDLRRTVAENADTIFTDAPQTGEEAEVWVGPFQGERGIVARVLPARQRVELLLEVMGRPLAAEFSLSSIIFKRKSVASRVLGENWPNHREAAGAEAQCRPASQPPY